MSGGVTRLNGSLRYLSRNDVRRLLPLAREQRELAETTYRALAAGRIELPPKPGVHPREDSFIHAMPAYLRDDDVAALKWVSGYATNKSRGLPYISGLVIVNDGATGEVVGVMDASEITAARTAAASAVCVAHFAPSGWRHAALIGCGEQGRYHAQILNALYESAELTAYDRHPERATELVGSARVAASAHDAASGAEVVITAIPIAKNARPALGGSAVRGRRVVIAIDFDASIGADVVQQADLFLVDDREQFEYYQGLGYFADWRAPDATIGEALSLRSHAENVVCCPLGVAALDAAFAAYVLNEAQRQEVGHELPA